MKPALRLLLCILQLAAVAVAQAPAPLIQNAFGRSAVSLNGDWHFIVDPYNVGISRRYYLNAEPRSSPGVVEYDFRSSPVLHVPGDWNSQRPELELYEGMLWYEKSFQYHRRALAPFRNMPFLCGLTPWILKDFRSPRRQLPGIQDGYNRKGLISDQGERKKAFFVLQQFYRELSSK